MSEIDRYALSKKLKQALELIIEVNSELTKEPNQPIKTPTKPSVDPLNQLPQHLATLLISTLDNDKWTIKPKEWIKDPEVFRKISAYLAEQHGTWINEGKNSRWEVPT